MKKYIILLLLILSLSFMIGCGETDSTPDTKNEKTELEKALEATTDGVTSYTIQSYISSASTVLYKEETVYTKNGTSFDYVSKTKTYNSLDEKEEYTEEETSGTIQTAYSLILKEDYLEAPTCSNGVLSSKLTSKGITELFASDITNASIILGYKDGKVTSLYITYEKNDQTMQLSSEYQYE